VLKKYLDEYGLDSELSEKIVDKFKSVNSFLKAEDEMLSKLLNLDLEKIRELKEYVRERSGNQLINDFLVRWGRVSSQEDLERAYEEYQKLSKLYPRSPVIWGIKGEILEKLNRKREAIEAYKKAYSLHVERGEIPPPELERKIKENEKRKTIYSEVPNRLSFSNGMINGFKNGLINGTGLVNGIKGRPPLPEEKKGPWRFMVSIIIILLIIFAPLMTTFLLEKQYIFRVDGNFEEWKVGIPYYGLKKATEDINIEFIKFHSGDNGIYFYIKTANEPFNKTSGLYIFVDTDNSTHTGYLVGNIGADYMAEIYGWNSTLRGKALYYFNSSDQYDFAGFHYMHSIPAVFKKNSMEGFMEIPASQFCALVISYNYRFLEDIAPCVFYGKRTLLVEESADGEVLTLYERNQLLKLHITGKGIIKGMVFKITGTANMKDLKFYLYADNGDDMFDAQDTFLSTVSYMLNDKIIFDNLNINVSNTTLFLVVTPLDSVEKTVRAEIQKIDTSMPYYLHSAILQASYIGKIPSTPYIDGSFADWKNTQKDPAYDVQFTGKIEILNANIDLLNYSAYNAHSLLLYLQVRGRILGGTDIPKLKIPAPPDGDRDTVPDKFDLYPHDFNNDGIPDNESYVLVNEVKYPDIDGDGIADYPNGQDMWLNTTIPSSFPEPYAGRDVRVYIGPVPHRKLYGMDTITIYVNSDGNKSTGFSLPQYLFGAEYKIEFVGRNGKIYESYLYSFHNGSWDVVRELNSSYYALGYHAIEVNTTLSNGDVLITLSDWKEDRDVSDIYISPTTKFFESKNLSFIYQKIGAKFDCSVNSKKGFGEILKSSIKLKAVFGEDVLVSNIPNSNKRDETYPSIVRTENTLWVTWSFERGNGNHDIAVAYSIDDGSTWEGWRIYGNKTFDTTNPVIVKDAYDNLFIFFENHTSGAYFQYLYHPNGEAPGNWILYGISSIPWENVYNISAAAYSSNIYVVFEYHNSSSNSTIGYLYTMDDGNTWHVPLVFITSYWLGHPSVTISTGSNPRVFIAFDYSYNTLLGLWGIAILNNSRIGNNSWEEQDYWFFLFSYKYPSIYASGDNIYVVWEGRFIIFNWDLIFLKSTDNGLTWSDPTIIENAATWDDEEYPWVVANGQDVYIFYLNSTTGYICMVESHDRGDTWSDVFPVSDEGSGEDGSGENIYRTVSAIYSGGKVYVVWTDKRNGNDDIYFDKVPEFNAMLPLIFIMAIVLVRTRKRKQCQNQ